MRQSAFTPLEIKSLTGRVPHDAEEDYDFAKIEELARDPKVVGIGGDGTGLFLNYES